MIVYADASALTKIYVNETGTKETRTVVLRAAQVGTALISRAEVASALAKGVRARVLEEAEARLLQREFKRDWVNLVRLKVTETLMSRAEIAVWEHGLRGYDSVHLASALLWNDTAEEPVTIATFDDGLWLASEKEGLFTFPDRKPSEFIRMLKGI
jgi:predicted nucleic acid-binding protein